VVKSTKRGGCKGRAVVVLQFGRQLLFLKKRTMASTHSSWKMNFLKKIDWTTAIAAGALVLGSAWVWRAHYVRSRIAKEQALMRKAHEAPRLGPNDVKVIVKVSMERLMDDVEERVDYTITQLENGKRETVGSRATIKFPAGMWSGLCVTK
jgi:hypothetical protein